MIPKPKTCEGCPLFHKGRGFVPDEVVPHPEYAFIGEAPGTTEVDEGRPFRGKAGYVLKHWLLWTVAPLRLAYEQQKITIGNVLRCLPPEIQGRAYPRGEERKQAEACCTQYLNLGTAHTVVLFGEMAQRRFFGEELAAEDASDKALGHDLKGVLGRVGRTYRKSERTWIFAPHPAWILRQPALVGHGQAALRIAANTERIADVEYVDWERAMSTA